MCHLNDDSLITEAALVAVEDGARTCPLIVLLEELLVLRVFDVLRVEVDVADTSLRSGWDYIGLVGRGSGGGGV